MRTLLISVPLLALLAAPAVAQTAYPQSSYSQPGYSQPGYSQAQAPQTVAPRLAPGEVDTSSRDFVPSRDLVGKPVSYRYGEGVAGTVQDVVTGSDGQPAIALRVQGADRPLILGASAFEKRGSALFLLYDRGEVAQLLDFERQGATGYGRTTGDINPAGTMPGSGLGR